MYVEFGKNKKKPKEFNGGRRASEIVQYVQSNPQAGLFEQIDLLSYSNMHGFLESAKLPKVILLGRNKNAKKGKVADVKSMTRLVNRYLK